MENPIFGDIIGLYFLTRLYAFANGYYSFLIKYAITMVDDLDIPIPQCTKTDPILKPLKLYNIPLSIQLNVLSKYYLMF